MRQAGRRDRPFVAVNCANLTEQLADAALFGHERGAFTSVDRAHRGYFEEADGGTLCLDEIGELPLLVQAKLLRALQEGAFRPLGAKADKTANVRIVAATHHDLTACVAERRFAPISTTASAAARG